MTRAELFKIADGIKDIYPGKRIIILMPEDPIPDDLLPAKLRKKPKQKAKIERLNELESEIHRLQKEVDAIRYSQGEIDEEHHAMMNGPRIQQSLPPEYLNALMKALEALSIHKQIEP